MSTETEIPAPKLAPVIQGNLFVLRTVFDWFKSRYLADYAIQITSEYRTPEHNAEIGGASNSAHIHGLALDFVLWGSDGKILSASDGKQVFESIVKPHWPGFSEYEITDKGVWHIHVNLSRAIGGFVGLGELALAGFAFFEVVKKYKRKGKRL